MEAGKRIIGRSAFQAESAGSSWRAFLGQQHYFAISRLDDSDNITRLPFYLRNGVSDKRGLQQKGFGCWSHSRQQWGSIGQGAG